jgi:UDP-N-acetylglucosamine:LPS N-acetylglucosamine transferase
MSKQTLIVILGRGGHTEQMLHLVNSLGRKYNYEYIIGSGDKISEGRIRIPGKVLRIKNPREMEDKNPLVVFFKLFKTTLDSLSVLFKSKSKFVITCGPGLGIPFSILAKLFFRKRIIFIESWSRVYSKSLAGKFIGPIASISFVQWPQQKNNYPNAVYAGRLG